MKKYVYLLSVAVFCSCAGGQAPKDIQAPVVAKDTAAVPGGCAAMPIFRQGAVIENRTIDPSGRELSRSINTISAVSEEHGTMISHMDIAIVGDSVIHARYKCDGKNFYLDLGTLMGKMKGATNIQRGEAWIPFPLDMKIGDTLSRQMAGMTFNLGKLVVSLQNRLSNSKVLSKEKVTTSAGSWDCFKIGTVMNIHSEMQGEAVPGKKHMVMDKQMRLITYFSVQTGVVKMELHEHDKVSSISEITAIR
jgi:hypothetical protein